MEEYIITKKNFEKYFNGNKIIDKSDYFFYNEMEKVKIVYDKIGEKINYFLTT